jgi:hypothetical protein
MIMTPVQQAKAAQPTKHRTGKNRYPLRCDMCRDLYYVDEVIIQRAYAALTGDAANIPFTCETCETDFAEAAHL